MGELITASNRALFFLAEVSVRALAVALLAALAAWLVRKRGAELRHAVWAAALAAMLLLPLLALVLPPVYLAAGAASPVTLPPADVVTQSISPVLTHPLPAAQPSRTVAWPVLLLAAYLIPASALLLRVAAQVRRTGRILRYARTLRDASILNTLSDLSLSAGRGYPLPALRESGVAQVPFAAGWRQPVIILPASWRSWDDFRLRAVLAHEMAHIRRLDWPISLLAAINRAVFFFHPLAWYIECRLAALAEESCDASALAVAGDPRRYAAVLFDFASQLPHRAVPVTSMARSSKVGARIERLISSTLASPRPLSRFAWCLLAALFLPVLYAAASIHPGQQPAPPFTIERQAESPIARNSIPGATFSPQQAAELEQRLAANPQDLEARTQLIGYYYSNGFIQPWLDHLAWAIEHHPEAPLHQTYPASFAAGRGLIQNEEDQQRLQNLWRRKAIQNPANVEVLLHAAAFLNDRDEAIRVLETARIAAPADPRPLSRLTELWVNQIFGNRMLNSPESNQRSQRALDTLLQSNDAALIGAVGAAHTSGGLLVSPKVSAEDKQRHAEYLRDRVSASEQLLQRAIQLDPHNPKWPEALQKLHAEASPTPQTIEFGSPRRIFVGSGVQERQLLEAPKPKYPPLALQAQITGVVRFTVVISPEGDVTNIQLISGHPLLVQAATEAVKQYRYRPTLLGGKPVEVVTAVEVPFDLPYR
jgi:TonB family protein